MKWQLYLQKDNKLYSKLSNSPAIMWNDGAINSDMVISSELHANAVTILGYPCNELVLYCKSGVQKYYFTSKFPVDPKLYIDHQFGNWYAYLSKAHAVPLKIVIDNAQFTLTSTATQIKLQKLDDAIFALPANAELTKSPY